MEYRYSEAAAHLRKMAEQAAQDHDRMPRMKVRVCGRIVELCFFDAAHWEPAHRSLQSFVVEDGTPDATFVYACGSDCPRIYEGQKELHTFYSAIPERNLYLLSHADPEAVDYNVYGHTLVGLFSRWADDRDMILLHAAAVGSDGVGVLVAGRSGRGKSTFAVSCLAHGLEFVADDYTMITASGQLCAMPVYTTAEINSDMHPLLPQLGTPTGPLPHNGKLSFAVPAARLSASLPIKAVVIPAAKRDAVPLLRPVPSGAALTQLVHSTSMQLFRGRDTALAKQMIDRLRELPAYEMTMCPELEKNTACLRRFLRERFAHVPTE